MTISKFNEAFESYSPTNGRWVEGVGSGDLVYLDGNTASASYLVISKSPLVAGTETTVRTSEDFAIPLDVSIGLAMSQNTVGQELSIELVDNDPLPDVPDLAISSITQTTTVLTVDTVLPHGLVPGKAIGIFGCSNTLANYPALVVASIPTPNQFTATAGPGGTIPSQTITNPAGAKGTVFFRERFGRSKNGMAQIFENASATQASLYVRSEAGDSLPSGTIAGAHSVTVGTRAPTQLVNSKDAFSFTAATNYRLIAQADRVQWADEPIDTTAQASNRLARSQVIPSRSERYHLRLRANNSKALTVPNAQIVSAAKAGSTTATVVTATPHGLALGDLVTTYGVRDQTNFANLTTATAVASVVDANTFTIVWGASVTATTFGGYVARVNGGNLPSALGANAVVAQSAVLTTRVDGTRELTITGNGSWSGLTIGDMTELVGARNAVDGATLGIDGPWKVANVVTTALTLVLPYAGQRVVIADFGSVNCGGAIIKRTCTRVSFVRITNIAARFDATPRPSGDNASAAPVTVQNTITATVQNTITATVASTAVAGTVAIDAAVGNPVTTGARAANANPAAMSALGDNVATLATMIGATVVRPYSIPEADWQFTTTLVNNTSTAVQAAGGAGIKKYLTGFAYQNTNATATVLNILRGTTVIHTVSAPASMANPIPFNFPIPLQTAANEALNVQCATTGANVLFNAQGYTAP